MFMEAKSKNQQYVLPFTIFKEKSDKKSWDSFNVFFVTWYVNT